MLAPKRAKHRKMFRGKRTGISIRGSNVDFGEFGLKATTAGWVSSRQIEAARRALTHYTRRGGRVWIRIFPDRPVTHKPPKPVWVLEKAMCLNMWQWFVQGEYFLKCRVLRVNRQ